MKAGTAGSRSRRCRPPGPGWLLAVLLASPAAAQPYEVSWHAVHGGGTALITGGPYVLSGTAGQPGAERALSGGSFDLFGGFWSTRAEPAADLSIAKSDSPDPVTGLDPLTYTIAVENLGPDDARSLRVADELPESVELVSFGGSGWSCGAAAGELTCTRVGLAPGRAPEISVQVIAPPAARTLTNSVSVSAAEKDLAPDNDIAVEDTTVVGVPIADLAVTKDDGGALARWGELLGYAIVVTNDGPDPVSGAVLEDSFPVGLDGVMWSCSASAGSSCGAGGSESIRDTLSLLPGGTATYLASGVVRHGTAGPLVNEASVSAPAGVHDSDRSNDRSKVVTDVDDLISADGFESRDLSAWSSHEGRRGRLAVKRRAAMAGTRWGLEARVGKKGAAYVQDDAPDDEGRYRARFYFDPNRFGCRHGDVQVFQAFETSPDRRLLSLAVAPRGKGRYAIRAQVRQDDGSWRRTGLLDLRDEPHLIEIDWARSPSRGEDGFFELFLDGTSLSRLDGLDNHRGGVDFVRMGALKGATRCRGRLRFDEFESRRRDYIGPR